MKSKPPAELIERLAADVISHVQAANFDDAAQRILAVGARGRKSGRGRPNKTMQEAVQDEVNAVFLKAMVEAFARFLGERGHSKPRQAAIEVMAEQWHVSEHTIRDLMKPARRLGRKPAR